MEGESSVNDPRTRGNDRHVGIHLCIHQPERDGLVPHQGLVVALGIGNALFMVASIGEGPSDALHVPILVLLLLQKLDPKVRDSHGQTVVKPKPSFKNRPTRASRRHLLLW